MREEHNKDKLLTGSIIKKSFVNLPFTLPTFLLNNTNMKIFNSLFINKMHQKEKKFTQHYDDFFFPLDFIGDWNKAYGKRGFYQFQCYIPFQKKNILPKKLLDQIAISAQGSFLSVLKTFGNIKSIGLLSFPSEGTTLCLDFANKGNKTKDLIHRLYDIVIKSGGKLYPAKDALMTKGHFKQSYSKLESFNSYLDLNINSSFFKRVKGRLK